MNFKNMTTAARRQLALYHLRVNPNNRNQTTGHLYYPETDSYCALGLLGEAFGYPVRERYSKDDLINGVYEDMCQSLGVRPGAVYGPNDCGKTFAQIADVLEKYFESHPVTEEQR